MHESCHFTICRSLQGIPPLVDLLHNDIPEVHRNALGALLNLSRGYENDDNKRAIKSCGGIESLATLLERSRDHDVRELITGILWNMSSLGVSIAMSVKSAKAYRLTEYQLQCVFQLCSTPVVTLLNTCQLHDLTMFNWF